jgi:hypothetical protein
MRDYKFSELYIVLHISMAQARSGRKFINFIFYKNEFLNLVFIKKILIEFYRSSSQSL